MRTSQISEPQVTVLMSVYNGKAHLKPQIESILRQTYPYIALLIRDDGSEEETRKLLAAFEEQDSRITVIYGSHVGAAASFFCLMRAAGLGDGTYFAFSDQDDYWLPEKTEAAVRALSRCAPDIPALYSCRAALADERLRLLPDRIHNFERRPGFGNALVENICFGCTEIFNRPLLELIGGREPDHLVMHDWWLYLVASYTGIVCFDQEAYILYRQHGGNSVGAQHTRLGELTGRLSRLRSQRGSRYEQARELALRYTGPEERTKLLNLFLDYKMSYKKTLEALFCREIRRQRILDNAALKLLFLTRYL